MKRFGLVLMLATTSVIAQDGELSKGILRDLEGKPEVRAKAIRRLAREMSGSKIPILAARLDDPSAIVRHEAAIALATYDTRFSGVVPVLRSALKAEDWWQRWRAAMRLRDMGPRAAAAVPELVDALAGDEMVSREAARAVSRIAPTDYRVVTGLVRALVDDKATRDVPALLVALLATRLPLGAEVEAWLGRTAVNPRTAAGRTARSFLLSQSKPERRDWFEQLFSGDLEAREIAIEDCTRTDFRSYVVPFLADPDVRVFVLVRIAERPRWSHGLLPLVVPHLNSRDTRLRAQARLAAYELGAVALNRSLRGDDGRFVLPPRGSPERAALLRLLADRALREAVAKLIKTTPDELLAKFTR